VTTQQIDFRERAREVAQFIKWLRIHENGLPSPLVATMRAAAFLLVYNMVESSARGLTEAIIDVVSPAGLSLADLSPHLRREFLRQAHRKSAQYDMVVALDDPAYQVTQHYDPREIFSGNVDARRIRERLVELGCPDTDFKSKHGINTGLLLNLRNVRNDLAHGTKSFGIIGATASQSSIEETFVAAWRTLRLAFGEVERLLGRNGHLK
jgi:hypothetical protein